MFIVFYTLTRSMTDFRFGVCVGPFDEKKQSCKVPVQYISHKYDIRNLDVSSVGNSSEFLTSREVEEFTKQN